MPGRYRPAPYIHECVGEQVTHADSPLAVEPRKQQASTEDRYETAAEVAQAPADVKLAAAYERAEDRKRGAAETAGSHLRVLPRAH